MSDWREIPCMHHWSQNLRPSLVQRLEMLRRDCRRVQEHAALHAAVAGLVCVIVALTAWHDGRRVAACTHNDGATSAHQPRHAGRTSIQSQKMSLATPGTAHHHCMSPLHTSYRSAQTRAVSTGQRSVPRAAAGPASGDSGWPAPTGATRERLERTQRRTEVRVPVRLEEGARMPQAVRQAIRRAHREAGAQVAVDLAEFLGQRRRHQLPPSSATSRNSSRTPSVSCSARASARCISCVTRSGTRWPRGSGTACAGSAASWSPFISASRSGSASTAA